MQIIIRMLVEAKKINFRAMFHTDAITSAQLLEYAQNRSVCHLYEDMGMHGYRHYSHLELP